MAAHACEHTEGSNDLTPFPSALIMYKNTSASMLGNCMICLSVNASRKPKNDFVSFGNA